MTYEKPANLTDEEHDQLVMILQERGITPDMWNQSRETMRTFIEYVGENREYLERKYGKRLMLFSGIHFNFSFSEALLREWNTQNEEPQEFRDALYLRLYKQLMRHSWLLVLLTAASPFYDASLDEDGASGIIRSRYASMRSSERGYWNPFLPILDHSDLRSFTGSIRKYIRAGMLHSASELYLPVRLKPRGDNSLDSLAENGVDHIELRMFDLNPFEASGLDIRDIKFAHLMLVWLAATPDINIRLNDQVHAVQNFKNAARYDLKTVYMYDENGESYSFVSAAKILIERMRFFFRPLAGKEVTDIFDYEYEKFTNAENRYAWRMRKEFGNGFVKKGLKYMLEGQKL